LEVLIALIVADVLYSMTFVLPIYRLRRIDKSSKSKGRRCRVCLKFLPLSEGYTLQCRHAAEPLQASISLGDTSTAKAAALFDPAFQRREHLNHVIERLTLQLREVSRINVFIPSR
jgi:hypothetical protein